MRAQYEAGAVKPFAVMISLKTTEELHGRENRALAVVSKLGRGEAESVQVAAAS